MVSCRKTWRGFADEGERRLFSRGPAEIAGDLRDLGVAHVDFGFIGTAAEEMLDATKRFRDDVLSRVSGTVSV